MSSTTSTPRAPGGGSDETNVHASLATLVGLLPEDEKFDQTLQRVVSLAQQTIGGCDAASVTLIETRAHDAETVVSSHDLALRADKEQYDRDAGPCLDAARHGDTYYVPDMTDEPRWGGYPAAAAALGVRSSLSIPLAARSKPLGALNLYAETPDAFSEAARDLARLFGAQASVAVANAQVVDASRRLASQLQEAMRSRAVIEQAKGILMAERGCDGDGAFELLKSASQRENVKLREIAERLVSSKLGSGRHG
jgi:GAF domain-containing protein